MNADGSEATQLTSGSTNQCPVISPDGSKIAFISNRGGNDKIYLMDLDGGGQHPLTETTEEEDCPSWAPDGTQIIHRKRIGGDMVICAVRIDGTNFKKLADGRVRYRSPRISPDGAKILLNALIGDHFEIWTMDRDGRNPHRIADSINWAMEPSWSPDGKRIVYTFYDRAPSPFDKGAVKIHVINSDGTGDFAVTKIGSTSEFPCWSPDGKRIAFQTYKDGNFEIYIVDSNGNNLRRITDSPAFEGRPSWISD
jgi:Tol biopolymer transport system component